MTEPEVIEAQVVEELRHLPAIRAAEAMVTRGEVSVEEIVQQHDKIIAVMKAVMKDGVHYGVIPGVGKPSLLKPGAEVLNVTLRLAPDYESEKHFSENGHLTVSSKCTLRHIPTQLVIAAGEGMASTRESKYAYRQGKRKCPDCGAEAIVRSTRKEAYFCISAEGGCGARFGFGTQKAVALDQQDTSKVDNPDLPDQWNTIIKMANKRALVAAVLNGTAASDVFTQDAEDMGTQQADSTTRGSGSGGSAGQGAATQPAQQQGVAKEGFPLPQSWPKVEEAIRAYGDASWGDWLAFSQQARSYIFSDVDGDLSREQKAKMRVTSAWAAKRLRDTVPAAEFPSPTRNQMRAAWHGADAALDNIELEGPPWRMSPDETDREAKEEPDA